MGSKGNPNRVTLSQGTRLLVAVATAANLLPAALLFYFVYRFGVDVPIRDEWDAFVIPLQQLDRGALRFSTLFAQFHEHRPLFPRLLTLANASLFHWNRTVEMYVTAVLLILCAWLLFRFVRGYWAHPLTPLLFLPMIWTLLSWRQWENLLWAFQTCFSLLAAGTVLAFCMLHRTRRVDRYVLAAAAGGFVASFSLGGGLFIFPVGLAQLLLQRYYGEPDEKTGFGAFAMWSGAGALTWALFFFGYHEQIVNWPSGFAYLLRNPIATVRFVAGLIGSPISDRELVAESLGMVMLALGVVAVFRLWRGARRAKDLVAAAPLLAFLMFTLLNAAVCCDRRLGLGMSQSVTSRYSSLTMLWLLALYALWAKFALTEPRPATLLACASLAVLMMTGTIANAVEWRYDHPEWFRSFALRTYAIRYAGVVSDEALLSVYWHPDLIRERSPFMRADGYSLFHREVPMGVPAKYNGSGGGCQIDSVNGRTGEVIDAHLQGDSSGLRVVGWAVDDAARHEPSRVFVSIDGQIDVPALTGGDLPDDVRFLRNSSYGQFGFISYMRTSLLTVGEHALELKIVSQDGSGYRTCGAARLRVTD